MINEKNQKDHQVQVTLNQMIQVHLHLVQHRVVMQEENILTEIEA